MRVEEFAHLLDGVIKGSARQGVDEDLGLSSEEVDEWMEIFGVDEGDGEQ